MRLAVASLWLGLGYASHHPDGAAAEEYEPTGATAAPAPHYTAVSPYSMAYGLRDSVSHKPLFSAGSSEIWEAQTGIKCPAGKFLFKSAESVAVLGHSEMFCLGCPAGKFAQAGEDRCYFPEWKQCSHISCKFSTHMDFCAGPSVHDKYRTGELCAAVNAANPGACLPLANPAPSCDPYGQTCASRRMCDGPVPVQLHSPIQTHISIYHHGEEEHGETHRCTYDDSSSKCNCICK